MTPYADWKVGDKIVCVDAEGNSQLRKGNVYTIIGIGFHYGVFKGVLGEFLCVDVAEAKPRSLVSNAEGEGGFAASRFRPVQPRKTSIEVFHRIRLNPSIRIREDA